MNQLFVARRERIIELMKKKDIDLFLVTNEVNVRYLTGFSGDDSFLLLTPDGEKCVLLSDSRYKEQITLECPDVTAAIRGPGKGMLNEILKTIMSISGKHTYRALEVGVEGNSVTLDLHKKLKQIAKNDKKYSNNIEWVPCDDWLEQQREIKDRFEVDAIREAVVCASRAFEVVRSGLLPGDTEKEISHLLDYTMCRLGADERSFPTIIASGPRAALPHATPTSDHHAGDHELLLLDWGARKNFYVSDITRVLITHPKPSAKLRKIYQIVLDAQKTAISAIKAGMIAGDVDAIARKVITDAGYGKQFGHSLGHGLGMLVHDRGGPRMGSKTVLKPGMVITIEPGIYLPGWGGIRIEDDILVTKNGCENLTQAIPKEFDEMLVTF